MQQGDFLPGDAFTDGDHGYYGEGVDNHIEGHYLNQDSYELLCDDADSAYGVGEKELGGSFLFLAAEDGRST